MSYKKDKKYKEALKLFYGANRYILNNRMLPGTPTLPSIVECLVTFTNTSYPELPVKLPKYIVNFKWAYITLPTVTGTYEDEYNFYTPVRWSIGDFNTNVLLKKSVKANLEFDVEPKTTTRTLSFTNTTYPQFIVDLPDPITAEIGDSVILPSVSGYFEDEEYLYIPYSWDIGSFGDSYTITGNTTSNLEWKVEHIAGFICGSIGLDYSESVIDFPPERMDRGGVEFTGGLRESIIPESGVVLPYTAKYSYLVLDKDTGNPKYFNTDTGIEYADVSFVSLQDEPLVIIEHDPQMYDAVTDSIYRMGLPNDHSGSYIKTSMDSLRYYAKGTLSNTGVTPTTYWGQFNQWYHGTLTWTDETLGDLTDKITVTPLTASERGKQAVFRIIFIYDGEISGVHSSDTAESTMSQITNYTYNNGTHSIEFYSDADWFSGTYSGRIQFRYLDGVTKFENLSTFDLVNISSGTLSKATSTDRFNMYHIWYGEVTIKAYY